MIESQVQRILTTTSADASSTGGRVSGWLPIANSIRRSFVDRAALGAVIAWLGVSAMAGVKPDGPLRADEPIVRVPRDEANESVDSILKKLVLDAVPHEYSDTKNWGHQTRVYDGFRFRHDDGRLETKRAWRMVNDGTWKKYSAQLVDPQSQFVVHLRDQHALPDGRLAFELWFSTPLRLHARQSKWIKGLQLYSLSADGSAIVRLALQCELDSKLDLQTFPPDILFLPVVKSAKLDVMEFRIDHVSKVGGEIAQQVTDAVRTRLEQEIDAKEVDLVVKINSQLEKKKDKLRLKLSEAVKLPWAAATVPLLPNEIRNALPAEPDK